MTEVEQLQQTLASLEEQRPLLGDVAVEAALSAVRQRLERLEHPDAPPDSPLPSPREPSSLSGERKLVTVMFADISGFTALSETMDAEMVRDLVNGCFGKLVPVVEKYGGVVDKFIGDEIMALFGAPIVHEDDQEWALRAALDMMSTLTDFNKEHHTDFGLHIGINTGRVVAGGIGSEGRQQYSVMGDAVNLASRLGDAAQRGEIFVGAETHSLTAQLFDFETVAPMALKGKASPVPVFRLVGVRTVREGKHGIPGLHSPMVGRAEEFRQLQSSLENLKAGTGCTISIIGEAGLGKSRLVAEARQTGPDGIFWVEGRALSYTSDMSFWPARSILHGFIGVIEETLPAEVGLALHEDIARLMPEKTPEVYPYLARLLDVPVEESFEGLIRDLSPEALQQRIRQAFTQYIRAQALQRPTVIVWEDLHWIDASSLSLVESLVPLTRQVPLILWLLFRPMTEDRIWVFHQALRNKADETYREIVLSPLSPPESAQLMQNLLNIEEIPPETRRLMFDKAEGNPFFLEELLRSLIDAGIVTMQDEKAVFAQALQTIDVPNTLQEVIAARIDRLPVQDKHTLQTASVVGRVFQQRVLKYIMEQEGAVIRLDPSLTELQRRELIRRRRMELSERGDLTGAALELEYIFKHAITQEVTYESLLIARRKALHRVAAEAIETLFADYLDPLAATLAYHYERADAPDKAVTYLIRAADRAKSIFANEEAIAFYHTAIIQVTSILERAGTPDKEWLQARVDLNEHLGEVLALIGKHDEALAAYHSALADVPEQDVFHQSRLHLKCAKVLEVHHKLVDSFRTYELAESVLGQPPASSSVLWWRAWLDANLNLEWLFYWQNQKTEMVTLAEKIQPILEQSGTPDQRATFSNCLSMIGFRRERYLLSQETIGHAFNAVSASQESENLNLKSWSHFGLGFSYLWADRLVEAEDSLQTGLKLSERTGDIVLQSRCLTYLTILYRRARQLKKFLEYLPRSLEVSTDARMTEYVGTAKANLSWAAWLEGKEAQAVACAEEAFAIWGSLPSGFASCVFQWTALMPLLDIAVNAGRLEDAVRHARALLEPPQKRLPESLTASLEKCVTAWEGGEKPEYIQAYCRHALDLARQERYL